MNRAELQLAHLTEADNWISPEEHVALHLGFSVVELHRTDTELRWGAQSTARRGWSCKPDL